jgi:hypothetical protein
MLTEDQIRTALHAGRVVALPPMNPHGPLGLEQLAVIVRGLSAEGQPAEHKISRPIALPVETWQKLDDLARELGEKHAQHVTPSELATAIVIQGVESAVRG